MLTSRGLRQFIQGEGLPLDFIKNHNDIIAQIELFLTAEHFPLENLHPSSDADNQWNSYWIRTSNNLINIMKNLSINKNCHAADLNRLVDATKGYINSREYYNPGRYVKTSYYIFSIVNSSPAFNRFNQSLSDFSTVKARLAENQKTDSTYFNFINLISRSISYLSSHPAQLMMFIVQSQALLAAAQMPKPSGMPDPIAIYDFNGNALDVTDNGNDGIVHGAIPTDGMNGQPYTAYYFDGASWIDGAADGLPDGPRSVSIYYMLGDNRISGKPSPGGMFFGYGGNGECGTSFELIINNGANAPANSYQLQSHCKLDLVQGVKTMEASMKDWHHFLVTTDGNGDTRMYVDGEQLLTYGAELDKPGVFSGRTYVNGTNFAIGALSDTGGKTPYSNADVPMFVGKIANISIFNKILHKKEVEYLTSFLPMLINTYPPVENKDTDWSWRGWELLSALILATVGIVSAASAKAIYSKCKKAEPVVLLSHDEEEMKQIPDEKSDQAPLLGGSTTQVYNSMGSVPTSNPSETHVVQVNPPATDRRLTNRNITTRGPRAPHTSYDSQHATESAATQQRTLGLG
jgi:hypothetical protein